MLSNKRVLLFTPHFFDYERDITAKLREMGAVVDYYDERPGNNVFVKAFIRINRRMMRPLINHYYNGILRKTDAVKYDYVFVVGLEAMSLKTILRLRQQQPSAKFILYVWDSLENKSNSFNTLPHFDLTFTFDLQDSLRINKLVFLPLFFADGYNADNWERKNDQEDIDLFFLGTIHSDRYAVLQKISEVAKKRNLNMHYYLFLPSPLLFWYNKLLNRHFKKAHYNAFNYRALSTEEVVAYLKRSKVIIDIQHPGQTGLTSRTIEMLGAKKKIITTNEHVKQYDFYNPDNIVVIDRNVPEIPENFFQSAYDNSVSKEVRFNYSIEGWLTRIFKLADPDLCITPQRYEHTH